MPYFCRSLISQALNHGASKSVSGSQILVLGVAYKPDIGDWRETPAEKLIHLLRERRRRRRVPRPVRAGVRRHEIRRRCSPRLRLRRDRDRPTRRSTTPTSCARGERDRRLPQRHQGARGAGQGLEAVTVSVGQSPASATGARTWSGTSTTSPSCVALRRRRRAPARSVRRALPERARDRATSTTCSPTRARRSRDRHAGADALCAREAGAGSRQARVRREAARDARRRDGRARGDRRRARASC